MWELAPWVATMACLVAVSAFFSASEAALFSLEPGETAKLKQGGVGARLADDLLSRPEQLLSAILFWNLVVNMTYFTLSSMVTLRLERDESVSGTAAVAFAVGSLVALIFAGEMMPKSLGVATRTRLAPLVSAPAALAVRAAGPVMPVLTAVMRLSTRFAWPGLESETRLDVDDLSRLIAVSTSDAQLILREQAVLRNIVQLSDIRADEWMRPRSQFVIFRPPVSLIDLRRKRPPSGYLLVTEPGTDEIARALRLNCVTSLPAEELEKLAEPVVYVPWCATVAEVLEKLRLGGHEVAAILNEYGETVGILTFDDILDTLFSYAPSRSKRVLDQDPIHRLDDRTWLVAGIVNVRRLAKRLQIEFPSTRNLTVSGVIQESLQRLGKAGDSTVWGPLRLEILEMPARGHMLVKLTVLSEEELELLAEAEEESR